MLGWDVPPEELVHIPEHWLSYPEPDHILHLILAIIYVMLFLVAIIGNGSVIWIFLT
jgi:r-opsin